MIDVKPDIVAALEAASNLPVLYELINKHVGTSAITYRTIDDADLFVGTTKQYSTIRYEIKIWTYDLAENITESIAVDDAMRALGFSRYFTDERTFNTQFIKIIRYVAIGYKR